MMIMTGAFAWSMVLLVGHYLLKPDIRFRYKIQYLIAGLTLWWLGVFTMRRPASATARSTSLWE